MKQNNNERINDRAQQVLKLLVDCYIREGQPVGSRTLVDAGGLGLSSATVRNVMADLEAKGYLVAPHTSAGRIPTARGLRFFVDSLLTIKKLDMSVFDQLQSGLNPDLDKQSLLANTSEVLSQLTRLAGLVTLPQREKIILRHVEFLPLSNARILVILVVNEREVRNLIIHTQREYTSSELEQAANYINYTYAGLSLPVIREQLLQALHEDKEQLDAAIAAALDIADKALAHTESAEKDYVLAGASNLIGYADGTDTLRGLFDAFAHKRDIFHLLEQCLQSEGVQIFIGEEAGMDVLGDFSLVTAPYQVEGTVVGVLGVIGPKHMPYDHVVQAVDVTAKLLGNALVRKLIMWYSFLINIFYKRSGENNMRDHEKDAKQKIAEMAEQHFQAKQAKENSEEGESDETVAANEKVSEDLSLLEKTVMELQQALADTEKKVEENRDTALRFRADIDNVRRQADRDIANAHKFGVEKFANALLPILDSLEQGIATIEKDQANVADAKYNALFDGMRMTLKLFIDMLEKFNIEIIDPVGEHFDPHWHEAITMQPHADVAPGTVLAVVQRGYRLNDRLLRPARVIVAKEA